MWRLAPKMWRLASKISPKDAENAELHHELPNWPKFEWDQHGPATQLAAVRHRQGRLIGPPLIRSRCRIAIALAALTRPARWRSFWRSSSEVWRKAAPQARRGRCRP